MTTPTTAAGVWPVRACYLATALFTGASGGTNLIYGWNKGTDLPSSLVWAAVSIGVSIVFALSWPAFIRSMDHRQWARSVMVLVALLVTGAYSVSAALGSASGGRANAATQERSVTDQRAKAQVVYDAAKNELADLAPTRAAGELRVLIEGVKADPRSGGCVMLQGSMQMRCPRLAAWRVELARAERRQELAATMAKAQSDLANAKAPIQANSDAVALASYLQTLGIETDIDRLNKLLVLLAVLVVECGGGLALTVGMSLSGASELAPNIQAYGRTQDDRTTEHKGQNARSASMTSMASERSPPPIAVALNESDKSAAGVRFLAFLTERGGVLASSQLHIGRALGWSKTWTHEVLHDLAAAGLVKLTTTKTGTVVQLARAVA